MYTICSLALLHRTIRLLEQPNYNWAHICCYVAIAVENGWTSYESKANVVTFENLVGVLPLNFMPLTTQGIPQMVNRMTLVQYGMPFKKLHYTRKLSRELPHEFMWKNKSLRLCFLLQTI